ncbi:hypothetical protein COCNU_01G007800 [Cocos nucifera]|uniref:GHMP kinase N-terminal domain-containing protein n=1 Tax=Cocos nucifera TaxID=13894 RepID=A0A8K0MUB8_COCNU|nr:hypothetical protein COCNU_01G007800 [Cocos nucifera]
MGASSWPSVEEVDNVRNVVAKMSGRDHKDVKFAVSPYRICPLGAHIDHQVFLRSKQFLGDVTFRCVTSIFVKVYNIDAEQYTGFELESYGIRSVNKNRRNSVNEEQISKETHEEPGWARYARGALYALQTRGHHLSPSPFFVLVLLLMLQGIIGYICGSEEHSSGLSSSAAVFLRSKQFLGDVTFRCVTSIFVKVYNIDAEQYTGFELESYGIRSVNKNRRNSVNEEQISKETHEEPGWARYARGALYALQTRGHHLSPSPFFVLVLLLMLQGIIGYICGSEEHSSGLSSSAALLDQQVGIAYLLALENANDKTMSPEDNVELDRVIENEYLNLKNGLLDQSAILLSKYGYLTCVDCKDQVTNLSYKLSIVNNFLQK